MAKLTRVKQNLFGSSAGVNEIAQFGSLAASSPAFTTNAATVQSLSNFLSGWFSAVIGTNSPAIEDMNALFFLAFRQLGYLFQAGIAEYDSGTTYYTGSFASDSLGGFYYSLTDSNTGNALSDTTNWKKVGGPASVKTKSATYQILAGDSLIKVSGTFTITMPDATLNSGARYTLKKTDSNSSTVTVATLSAQTIDTASTYSLIEQFQFLTLQSDGSNWLIVSAG